MDAKRKFRLTEPTSVRIIQMIKEGCTDAKIAEEVNLDAEAFRLLKESLIKQNPRTSLHSSVFYCLL